VAADIGVVLRILVAGVLDGDKGEEAAPDRAAPPVVSPMVPGGGTFDTSDGPFVAGSDPCSGLGVRGGGLGARGGGLGKADEGPFVAGSEP
jgi:hypothetical protein